MQTQGPSLNHPSLYTTVIAIVTFFYMAGASANSDAEREVLARLVHEIAILEPLVSEAESQANSDTCIRFRYAWLREDLKKIRSGIQDHIDAPRNEPRIGPPLRGDYRQ
ncbi:RAQPRD family integrative conjugative element protein [Congregibacter litoralis]|jgi:RAQPRD family integrative conjugative element protein|uniref:Integrative conjugative element protein, RAQPRD family n=1 Tax=Congregibacter litoralis KT71 TaxID=314285 RepID=A4AE37_9GAMM|nr:RAQPRD family integrative conjugative element protein [Congregibacter litoralis]EAQ95728.1 integrative conjugative element protein, RAQPRD family [Congregibacter litoralis KT71]